ncbi:hypothetical protein IscW_ISCW014107 [Ixodes scapularis]|uniref:RFX-type winged-helix domain-containing protein n=1 Tax=Ixodes scapularis TaxID=6945 RepID=B7QLP6_IXOSC|nr:hypothetical protein IscW_ISCW014107 [Ixodes scapularis]|eukprot:XP_002416101.1 hypothetical protein IscW_ISCW014107 [Ixodes scapularis]
MRYTYLSLFEKVHFLGEDADEEGEPSSDARNRKSNASVLVQVPMFYNRAQHDIPESQRLALGLAASLGPPSEYNKLCLSLLSGLPNEEALSLNVCTLLSNEGRHALRLDRVPRLLDLLLAQAGLFSNDDPTLRPTLLECWQGVESRRMERFWEDNLDADTVALFNIGRGGFVMLCALSRWSSLRQVALDTIGNLASKVRGLSYSRQRWSCALLRLAREGVQSQDRYLVVRCLDILARLCRQERNARALLPQLDAPLCRRIFELLTVHDLMLLIYALEALYMLSEMGRDACERLLLVHKSIGILVSLLTLDPLAYGPLAQKGMKLIETVDPLLPPAMPVTGPSSSAPAPHPRVAAAMLPHPPPEAAPSPSPVLTLGAAPSPDPLDTEAFAGTWVRAMYEPAPPGCSVARNDIYAEYVTFCSKAGRKSVISASVFANCVKAVYSQTGIRRVDNANGMMSFHHDGLRKRLNPLPVPIQVTSCLSITTQAAGASLRSPVAGGGVVSSHSPILKAQLSAPLRSLTPPTGTAQGSSPPPSPAVATPVAPASPATSATATTSSPGGSSNLIKSLLANKARQVEVVRREPNPAAVAPVVTSVHAPGPASAAASAPALFAATPTAVSNPAPIQTHQAFGAPLVVSVPTVASVVAPVSVPTSTPASAAAPQVSESVAAASLPPSFSSALPPTAAPTSTLPMTLLATTSTPALVSSLTSAPASAPTLVQQVQAQNQVLVSSLASGLCQSPSVVSTMVSTMTSSLASSVASAMASGTTLPTGATIVMVPNTATGITTGMLVVRPQQGKMMPMAGGAISAALLARGQALAAGGTRGPVLVCARPNGFQRDIALEVTLPESKPATEPPPQSDRIAHNHVGENGSLAGGDANDPASVKHPVEEPVVAADPQKPPEVVYKSSPLLNGLLDKGKVPLSKDPSLQNGGVDEEMLQCVDAPTVPVSSAPPSSGVSVVVTNGTCAVAAKVVTSSDLSPISDIVGSVESASKAISRSNVEAVAGVAGTDGANLSGATKRLASAAEEGDSGCAKRLRLDDGQQVTFQAAGEQRQLAAGAGSVLQTTVVRQVAPVAQQTTTTPTVQVVQAATSGAQSLPQPNLVKLLSTTDSPTGARVTVSTPSASPAPTIVTVVPSAATTGSSDTTEAKVAPTTTAASRPSVEAEKKAAALHHHHHHHHHHHKPAKLVYNCEWKGCERTFSTPSAVFYHACKVHIPEGEGDLNCQWEACDDMKRRRLSLFTHLQVRRRGELPRVVLVLPASWVTAWCPGHQCV